jgi:hypothetical protein
MQKYIHKENLTLKEQEGCRCLLWYRDTLDDGKVLSPFPPFRRIKKPALLHFTKHYMAYTIVFSAEFVQHTFACLRSSSRTNSQSLEILL